MWERIGESSAVIIGAVVLFLLFAAVLFIMERDEFKKKSSQKTKPYLVPKPEHSQSCTGNVRHLRPVSEERRVHNISVRKIS